MTCYLSEPGVEGEISTFFVNIFKNRPKFKKMKKPILDNFILFLKINESHFLIKPNFCYAVQENLMVTMVTDEFIENRIILQKSVATIGFIWFFWFQKCILLYIFVQIFLEMRCIRSHISFFRLGLTPTLSTNLWTCTLIKYNVLYIVFHEIVLETWNKHNSVHTLWKVYFQHTLMLL